MMNVTIPHILAPPTPLMVDALYYVIRFMMPLAYLSLYDRRSITFSATNEQFYGFSRPQQLQKSDPECLFEEVLPDPDERCCFEAFIYSNKMHGSTCNNEGLLGLSDGLPFLPQPSFLCCPGDSPPFSKTPT